MVKNLHFSVVRKWSTQDNLHVYAGCKSRDERQVLSGWCLLSKRDRTHFSKCHMTKLPVILGSLQFQKGRRLCLVHQQYYLTHRWGNKGVHAFLKDIIPKVNIIA